MKSNYYCFTRGGKYYGIDTVRIIPMQIKEKVYYELKFQKEIDKEDIDLKTLEEKGFNDLVALAKQDILFHSNEYKVKNNFRELNISLIPTQSCNLNCKYCYSHGKKDNRYISPDKIKDTMNFFCEYFPFSFCRVDFVGGGEPLYDLQELINMVNIISEILDENNKEPIFWLCTNGLLLKKDILYYLDKKHFYLGISLDGSAEINDFNRVDLNGYGTYNRVVKKILDIKNSNELSRNIKDLWNCAVITSNTKSLVEILQHSYELGFRNLQMKMVWSDNHMIRLSNEKAIQLYEDLTNFLFSLIEEKNINEFLCICNENDTYGKILLRIIIQSGVTRRCNAGVNKFSISPEGKLYPCDSFLGIEEYCIGDIYNGFNSMYQEFSAKRNDDIEKCRVCWARYICGGDCYYHSFLNNGSPWIPDNQMCILVKEITKMCISLVVDLYLAFPDEMRKVYSILSKKVIRMEPKL